MQFEMYKALTCFMVALFNRETVYIFMLWFVLLFFFFFLAQSQRSEIGCLPYFGTWCGLSANAGLKRAARGSLQIQDAKNRHFGTIAQLCWAISSELRHVSTIGKKLVKQLNTSSICPDNMVNFGLLTTEICWRVWGTPSNFNGFRILAALVHGTLVAGVSQTLWC